MKIYSKQNVVDTFTTMIQHNRLPHAFLLYGEKGVGKKTLALYLSQLMLCESGNACGKCRNCTRIEKHIHPDVIMPERSGKTLIYRRETVRNICTDAFVAPNDCDRKIYIFSDCEKMEEGTQNLLLKLIEEPPDQTYFIFTATDRSAFLPTILSRVISIGVSGCNEDECRQALTDMQKYTDEQINEAIQYFPDNIGNCTDYLEGEEIVSDVCSAKNIINGIINGNEYDILKALNDIGDNRDKIKDILVMTDRILRDAMIIRLNGEGADAKRIGCYRDGAEKLSSRLSLKRIRAMHESLNEIAEMCSANVNTSVAISALAGMLMQ